MLKRELPLFLIVGTLTVLVDFVSYRGLYVWGSLGTDFAKGAGFLAGTVFAYFANRVWTFGHKNHTPGSIWRFMLLYTVTLAANVAINALSLTILPAMTYTVQLAFVIATGVSAALNFLGMKWFVFKAKPMPEQI